MEFNGKLTNVSRDFKTDAVNITFTTDSAEVLSYLPDLEDKKLKIKAVQYRKSRSLDANAMLWACISKIATALRTDTWSVYLQMLKRYGIFEIVVIPKAGLDQMQRAWRELEVIAESEIDGCEVVQLRCFYGSSTYDTKQFSVLLDGVISEMKEMDLEVPPSEDMKRSLEAWERNYNRH